MEIVGHLLDVTTGKQLPVVVASADGFDGQTCSFRTSVQSVRFKLCSKCSPFSFTTMQHYRLALDYTDNSPTIRYIGRYGWGLSGMKRVDDCDCDLT